MSQPPDTQEDDLLDSEGLLALETLASLLPEAPVAADRKEAILGALTLEGRLERFASRAASMLDVDIDTARKLLDGAALFDRYEPSPFPGVRLHHVSGGPKVANAITGFVRIEGGASFPDHDHMGVETVLIMQGSCVDLPSGMIYRPGDVVAGEPGAVHSVVARPGPDLVYLAVLEGGLLVGGQTMLPGDPSI